MRFAAIFSIIVGGGMKGQWAMTYITHQIPELKSEPIRIWFHIVAEMVTAISLITGGIGLLMQMDWGKNIFLISIGMLFYTSIVSPGYFAQKGQWIWLAMFAAVMLLGSVSLFLVL